MISLVIPVYRNAESIAMLLERVASLDDTFGGDFEAVFVVDGSPDDSILRLGRALPEAGFRSQLLSLSRNFGSFAAIRAGMEAARGDYVAVMAADCQEPAELIVEFHERLRSGDFDVAVGVRDARADPTLSKLASSIFWGVYRRLVLRDIPPGGVDVFAVTRDVRDQLLRLRENNSSLVGLLFWVGFRRAVVPYQRLPRLAGRSAWTLAKKLRYLDDSLYAFSDLPVRVLLIFGTLALALSVVFGTAVVVAKLLGRIPVPGYAATVLTVVFFGALNCLGIGIIGGYVWRTFENSKVRPNYIVSSHEVFGSSQTAGSDHDE